MSNHGLPASQRILLRTSHWEAQKGRCGYCKRQIKKKNKLDTQPTTNTLEHIIPISRGGTNTPSNTAAVCFPCNQARGNNFLTIKQALAIVSWGRLFPVLTEVSEYIVWKMFLKVHHGI